MVNLDCEKLYEIQLLESLAYNHATPHVCPIISMQILTGFNQEKTSCKKAKIQSKLMSTEICKNRPLVTSEMSAQSLIAARSYPSFQNLKKTTQTENKKSEKEKFVKFEYEIFTNKKFSSIKLYHSKKLNHARCFGGSKIFEIQQTYVLQKKAEPKNWSKLRS